MEKFVFATPQIGTTSSVFLTPPFSDEASKTVALREMDVHSFPLIKNLVLSPATPAKEPAADLDIISLLYLQGALIGKISAPL